MSVYVVLAPPSIRGIYETWEECVAAKESVRRASYRKVPDRESAEALLSGKGIALGAGTYAFTDGNAQGGVGIVIIDERATRSVTEISMSVHEIFSAGLVHHLESGNKVDAALARIRNILAELAALYHVVRTAPEGSVLAIVHDYTGVAEWMEGRWKTNDAVVAAVIHECRRLVRERGLTITFRHQRGHQATRVGRDDFAVWNARADELARLGAKGLV